MEVDWINQHLSTDFLNSIEFRKSVESVLANIWPLDGVTQNWASYYDTWHRHLIPLSDFMMKPHEAIVRFGLLHFSPDEDARKLEVYWQDQKAIYDKTKQELMDKIETLSNQDQTMETKYELEKFHRGMEFLCEDDWNAKIKSHYEDENFRSELIKQVGDRKDDPRRYVMIHHCFDNVKTIYLMMNHLFPTMKWGLILSSGHALITTGTPEQLETYLFHDETHNDFLIAEPIASGRDMIAALMTEPTQWKWFTRSQDIMMASEDCLE